jgi:uncharacterized membrane protein
VSRGKKGGAPGGHCLRAAVAKMDRKELERMTCETVGALVLLALERGTLEQVVLAHGGPTPLIQAALADLLRGQRL